MKNILNTRLIEWYFFSTFALLLIIGQESWQRKVIEYRLYLNALSTRTLVWQVLQDTLLQKIEKTLLSVLSLRSTTLF